MKPLVLFLFTFSLLWNHALADDSIVDTTSPLETIATDFDLADGPAWDGGSNLYFPDVKGEKLYRFSPRTGKVSVFLDD
ncbi:MAG TPA: hypothetical protein DDZ90_29200, partial [Planctomycetaceae bacterium]|nr:hypothetical protein [Planctomycetaceae bacterium]